MEKQRFEEDIRSKLEGHSSKASPEMWEKLEQKLDNNTRTTLSTSRFRYAVVAAIFALVVVSFSLWKMEIFVTTEKGNQLTKIPVTQKQAPVENNNNHESHSEHKVPIAEGVDSGVRLSGVKETSTSKPEDFSNQVAITGKEVKSAETKIIQNSFPDFRQYTHVTPTPVDLRLSEQLDALVARDLSLAYKVADAVSAITPAKKVTSKKSSWLAVGFASGNYQQQVLAGSTDVGVSRSSSVHYGRNFGRLALFSGLALTEQQYNNSSNLALGASSLKTAVSSDIITGSTASSQALSATNTYLVNTQKRYLSIPIQAGWYVVDRKVKGMFSAGIMTDYFLSSTISDVSGVLQSSKVTHSPGAAYAGWVFSGLVGSEWSMSLSDRYQVAISPGVRYALTPVYRKDFLINGKSYALDVGVRLRYFFDR
jgi:hypothetical protein